MYISNVPCIKLCLNFKSLWTPRCFTWLDFGINFLHVFPSLHPTPFPFYQLCLLSRKAFFCQERYLKHQHISLYKWSLYKVTIKIGSFYCSIVAKFGFYSWLSSLPNFRLPHQSFHLSKTLPQCLNHSLRVTKSGRANFGHLKPLFDNTNAFSTVLTCPIQLQ